MLENFNYISFGNRSWLAEDDTLIEMGRGRMFEHTPTDTEQRLVGLDGPALAFLEKLPTFLCSEIDTGPDQPTMLVRFGHLRQIRADKKVVAAQFSTAVNFGEVQFPSVEAARKAFGIVNFQLYRTHWAVRPGNYRDVLTNLADFSAGGREAIARYGDGRAGVAAEPPERRKNEIGEADSVESFLKVLFDVEKDPTAESFYRGHEDGTFELTPSLLRKVAERIVEIHAGRGPALQGSADRSLRRVPRRPVLLRSLGENAALWPSHPLARYLGQSSRRLVLRPSLQAGAHGDERGGDCLSPCARQGEVLRLRYGQLPSEPLEPASFPKEPDRPSPGRRAVQRD